MKRLLNRRTRTDRPDLEPIQAETIEVRLPAGFDANADSSKLLEKLEPVHGRDWKITRVRDGIAHLKKVEPTLLGRLSMLALKAESDWKEPGGLIDVSTHDLLMALIMIKERHNLEGHMIREIVADLQAIASAARTAKSLTCRVHGKDLREFVLVIRHLENQYLRELSAIGIPPQRIEAPPSTIPTFKENTVPQDNPITLQQDNAPDEEPRLIHTIELTGNQYADLMQLVMEYGTGTGLGYSTSIGLRLALARAETRVA